MKIIDNLKRNQELFEGYIMMKKVEDINPLTQY